MVFWLQKQLFLLYLFFGIGLPIYIQNIWKNEKYHENTSQPQSTVTYSYFEISQ